MLQTFNEKNRNLIVCVNGKLTHRDEAAINPFDSSVQNGDAVWEGLRLYDGRIFKLTEHLARLRKSATMLSYVNIPDDATIIDQLKKTLAANQMHDGVHIRLTLTRGPKYTSGLDPRVNLGTPTLIILPEHKPPVFNRDGITLITANIRRPNPDVLNQHIHSSNQLTSILAKLEANAAHADDALLLDQRGYLAETSSTHVFIVEGDTVVTPTTFACPEGITRATILELCRQHHMAHEVCDITPRRMHAADEMFVTGTMGELVPVLSVDGRAIGDGKSRAITDRLTQLFKELTRTQGVPVC
ncbi:MAG: aminotransferase IV [Planctomycetes bacterium]|nr:aminotransferase IV [Planctomycetota bacterium]